MSIFFHRFRYSIKAGAQGHFRINPDNGQVATTARLDRENIAKYQLSIVAQDVNEKCHKGLCTPYAFAMSTSRLFKKIKSNG